MDLRPLAWSLGCALTFAACGGGGGGGRSAPGSTTAPASSSTTTAPTASTTTTTPTPAPFGKAAWPHLAATVEIEEGRFATSTQCSNCHAASATATALHDAAGRAIGPFDLWQASMMANAARDPLWRAQVAVEILATPSRRAEIETKCVSCHSPMAAADAQDHGQTVDLSTLSAKNNQAQLALDGVSCTFCHQLSSGASASTTFSGNWTLSPNRELYGPHDAPYATPMSLRTRFLPAKGTHVSTSASCATCHVLTTTAFDASGKPTGGKLAEQSVYLEWQNSAFVDEGTKGAKAASCQACHVPQFDEDGNPIKTRIARESGGQDFPSIGERSPVGRHLFVGGNALVPAIIRDAASELRPQAPPAAFDAVIAATRKQLANDTATVTVGAATRTGDRLSIPVSVTNRTGHKFPTGHPTRRAWLRVRVRDAKGRIVFASGEHDLAGRLVDRAGQPLASELVGGPVQPHRTLVSREDEVQIYESVMGDAMGAATWLLLRGEQYVKDDRLLPEGWSPAHAAAAETRPSGTGGDPAFRAGGHSLVYAVNAPAANGPYEVEATLLYQPLGARFAAELLRWRAPEVEAFAAYYAAADRTPDAVSVARAQVR